MHGKMRRIAAVLVAGLMAAQTFAAAEEAKERKDLYSNAAVLLDRKGKVAGIYRKVFPVASRDKAVLEGGVTPGRDFPVFDCDFGRVGIQVCFDYAYDEGWEVLDRKGAELVIWSTQSPGQIRPAFRARRNNYFVLTSTWRYRATFREGEVPAEPRRNMPRGLAGARRRRQVIEGRFECIPSTAIGCSCLMTRRKSSQSPAILDETE